ncbi:MAG: hypothetical protein LC113_11635 [Acidobacteria bacterium]|nr:hypothetical protein [Acidobacteriota bacterium]
MRICLALFSILFFAAFAAAQTEVLAPQPVPFTYQGKLVAGSAMANGQYDFLFRVCTTNVGETCSDQLLISNVAVTNGIFTVDLAFPPDLFPADPAQSVFLEISVKLPTDLDFTLLSPRQPITHTPRALSALTADSAKALNCSACIGDTQITSISAGKVTGKVASASNADNAANATTAQYAVNAVDLTSNQGSIGGTKRFNDRVTLSGGAQVGTAGISSNGPIAVTGSGTFNGNGSGLINVPGTLKWNVSPATSLQLDPNNGYVLTNSTAATVTLPASPAVGDVVRVIEKGTGGFTLAMNSGQSILDWATTHMETTWTRQYTLNAYPDTANFVSIATSADGQRIAAVEYLNGLLYLSQNGGQTWTSPMLDSRNYTCVAASADGSKLIASVEGGHLFTSADWGGTWTERFADANRNWYSVAVSGDGTKFYAVDTQSVWTSTNGGVSWTAKKSMSNHVGYIAASSDGTKLVLAEHNGHVWTSSDSGATWIDRLSSTFNQWQSVASSADGSKLAAVDSPGFLWISSDSGATWTQKTSVGPSGANTSWASVSMSSDGMRIAASAVNSSPYPGVLTISYDGGTSWTPTGSGTSWTAVAFAGSGSRLSASMSNGASNNKLYTGPVQTITVVDTITGVKDSAVELVYIGSNKFAMVTNNNMTIPPHNY